MRGPAAASVSIELQTKSDCDDEDYASAYYTLDGLAGDIQTVSVPLSSFGEENVDLSGVVGVVWFGFSPGSNATDNGWALDDVQLGCAAVEVPVPEPTPTPTPTPTSSGSVVPPAATASSAAGAA